MGQAAAMPPQQFQLFVLCIVFLVIQFGGCSGPSK